MKFCAINYALLLINLFLQGATSTAICNARTDQDALETVADFSTFENVITSGVNQTLVVLLPAKVQESKVRLVEVDEEDGTGDVAGSIWIKERKRLADGFLAEIQVSINGSSDGFAVVAQNDKIANVQGSLGDALGFKGGLDNYLGVGFDICPNRPNCDTDIRVSIVSAPDVLINETFIPENMLTRNGNTIHTIGLYYLADLNLVEVDIDDENILSTSLAGNDIKGLMGNDRFGWIGCTASNAGNDPANIDLHSLKLLSFQSDSKIRDAEATRQVAIGTATAVTVDIVNSCNEPSSQIALQNNVTVDSFDARLIFNPGEDELEILPLQVVEIEEYSYDMLFEIRFLGNYTLEASVNGAKVQGTPKEAFIIGIDDFGIPTYALAILISLLILVVALLMLSITRALRYRYKLNKYKDAIEGGREAERIEELEKPVIYEMSPLQGDLATLKAQLQKNEEELRELKSRHQLYRDPQQLLDQLRKENAALTARLNELKKAEQQSEAFHGKNKRRKADRLKRDRKEFIQERASITNAHLQELQKDFDDKNEEHIESM